MGEAIKILELALQLERMATLMLMGIGGAIIYVLVYKIPPMIASTLESVSKSLERISITMAELVLNTTMICAETGSHSKGMTIHHENALEIRTIVCDVEKKVDTSNQTLDRIETILNQRPCIK